MQKRKSKVGIGFHNLAGVFLLGLGVFFLIGGFIQLPISGGGIVLILTVIGLFFVGSAMLLFGHRDRKRIQKADKALKKDWGEY